MKLFDYVALTVVAMTFLVPTLFTLAWLVHLLMPISSIVLLGDIALGSMMIGIIGIHFVSKKYPEKPKNEHEENESGFYSSMLQCFLGLNMGVIIFSGFSNGLQDVFTEMPFGMYGLYGILGASGILIAVSIISMSMLTIKYRRYLKEYNE